MMIFFMKEREACARVRRCVVVFHGIVGNKWCCIQVSIAIVTGSIVTTVSVIGIFLLVNFLFF